MTLGVAASVAVVLSVQIAAATPESDAAHDAITAAWQAAGGDGSPLGAPQGDVYPAGAGFAQDFAGGKMFFSPGTGAKALYGAILNEYVSTGGPADMGFPNIEEVPGLASPDSRVVTFSGAGNPVIYWTPEHGAHVVRGPINAAWDKLGSSTGALGVPVDDESYAGPVVTQKFTGGQLSFSGATKAFTTVPPDLSTQLADLQVQLDPTAAIDYVWRVAGGDSGLLGARQGAPYAVGDDGTGQDFAAGKVYFSPATGANGIEGEVLAKYESLGGPVGSDLGFPIVSESAGTLQGSRVSKFAAADEPVIFFTPDNGAFVVRGAMKVAWDKLDGASGKLGAPVGDQTVDGDLVSQKFTGGQLSWNRATNTFSAQPAELAKSLSGLQIPGVNLPGTSKSSTGAGSADHGGGHWHWSWLLIPAAVLAVLGLLTAVALWWQRRRPAGPPAAEEIAEPVEPETPAADEEAADEWSGSRHEADATVRLPSHYAEAEPRSGVEPLGSPASTASWPGFTEVTDVDTDDTDDIDTAPTRVPSEEELGTGRHAVAAQAAPSELPSELPSEADTSVQPVMHLPLEDPFQQPDGYPIKASIGSGLYYTADDALYEDTLAEIWFATEDAAQLNGFVRAR